MAKNLNKQHQLMRISQAEMRRSVASSRYKTVSTRANQNFRALRLQHAKANVAKTAVRLQVWIRRYQEQAQQGFIDWDIMQNLGESRTAHESAIGKLDKLLQKEKHHGES